MGKKNHCKKKPVILKFPVTKENKPNKDEKKDEAKLDKKGDEGLLIEKLCELSVTEVKGSVRKPPPLEEPVKYKHPLRFHILLLYVETSGPDPTKDKILQVSCAMVEGRLREVRMGPTVLVQAPDDLPVEPASQNRLKAAGLPAAAQKSDVSMAAAEALLLEFLESQSREQEAQAAGQNVYVALEFIQHQMPRLHAYLSHRIIELTTIQLLASWWCPHGFQKKPHFTLKPTESNMGMAVVPMVAAAVAAEAVGDKARTAALRALIHVFHELAFYRQSVFKSQAW